jgi:hypothetical protein
MENLEQLPDNEVPYVDIDQLAQEGTLSEEQFSSLAAFDSKTFALELLNVCAEYVGIDRENNLDQVSRFLKLFNLGTRDGKRWMPYCAAGLSFAAAKNLCNLSAIEYEADNAISIFKAVLPTLRNRYFLPNPSCYRIRDFAIKQKKWLPNSAYNRSLVKPGYLVLFQFDSDTLPDHIGIVRSIDSNSVQTIEFNTGDQDNTNGGAVAKKDRPFNVIQGFIKLY